MLLHTAPAKDVAVFRCSYCPATHHHVCFEVNGRPPDSAEVRQQMRAHGWKFSAILWGPLALSLCPDCEYKPDHSPARAVAPESPCGEQPELF